MKLKELQMYKALYYREKKRINNIITNLIKYEYLIPDEYRSIIKEILKVEGINIMNKLMFKLKKKLVNKKENTRKLKYESLLEENKTKNDEIIKLYERNELKDKEEDYERQLML